MIRRGATIANIVLAPGKLANKAGAQYWWVMTETTVQGSCPVLGINKVTDGAVTSQTINSNTSPYTKGGDWNWPASNPTVNVDHVCEFLSDRARPRKKKAAPTFNIPIRVGH